MKMTRTSLLPLCLTLVTLSLAAVAHGAQPADDDSDLPVTLRRGYVDPIVGPADDRAYAHGALGLIRPGYGRASLFVAWRVMHLPVGAVVKESHRREGDWLHGAPVPAAGEDEIAAWLKAREALVPQAPAVAPDYFRHGKLKVAGFGEMDTVTGHCGPDAYAFATRTLRELVADASLRDADRRAWITGQDAVFARCTWTPGTTPAPALPAPLPAAAPAKAKALNAYQHAAALFYGDEFAAARKEFDAMAAVPKHPMRAWAALGALRCVVRDAVRDAEWASAWEDEWSKRQLRGAALNAAVAEPAARHGARVSAALKEIDTRAKAATGDATLAPVHGAITYTVRRALLQLAPAIPLRLAMDTLDRSDYNPYAMGALDLFQDLYPRVSPDRPEGALATAMRQHAWFDFVITVQACADAPKALDTAACDSEHAHALARWQETKDNAWLLATLMTARQPSAADVPAADAARAVATDRPEWASLQFYAARVLGTQGRAADARAMVEGLAASPVVHKRDRALLEAEQPGIARRLDEGRAGRVAASITEEQVRAEYDRVSSVGGRTEYKVRHILVQTKEQAQAALDRLRGGEAFESVAAAVSADPGSRARGGDLGWSLPSHFIEPFAEAMKRLSPRGLAQTPVQTQFGWHVIEVTDVRPRAVPPYEQVKGRILQVLQQRAAKASE
jgi:hypothetical protein